MLRVSILHHLELPKALEAIRPKMKPGVRFAFSEPNMMNPINKYVVFTDDLETRKRHGISPTEMAFCPDELRDLFEQVGYRVEAVRHRDFLHPAVPRALISVVRAAQFVAERTPLVRRWSGSLWVHGSVPEA